MEKSVDKKKKRTVVADCIKMNTITRNDMLVAFLSDFFLFEKGFSKVFTLLCTTSDRNE